MVNKFALEHIHDELAKFIRDNILAEGVCFDEDTPFSSIGVDSLSLVQVMLFLERKFDLVIPDSYLNRENLYSLGAFISCLSTLLGQVDGEEP